jgi:hypothetical protein
MCCGFAAGLCRQYGTPSTLPIPPRRHPFRTWLFATAPTQPLQPHSKQSIKAVIPIRFIAIPHVFSYTFPVPAKNCLRSRNAARKNHILWLKNVA